MPDFERGTVVRVPFPYTDRPIRQYRPALVVGRPLEGNSHLLWVLMITSAENHAWPSDVSLVHSYQSAGLPAPLLIRTAKIATIEAVQAQPLGRIAPSVLEEVVHHLRVALALVAK